jgi:acetyl esterase/lipase
VIPRIFTDCAALIVVFLSAWIIIPAPSMSLLPFNVVVPEIALGLFLFSLIVIAFAKRWRPILLLSLALTAWPLLQIYSVSKSLERQGFALRLRLKDSRPVQPEVLPRNIHFFRPEASGIRPAVIDIYGGAWQRGSPSDDTLFHQYLASSGYAVFAIDYRHAPGARFPEQMEDVRAALSFIYQNAAGYNVDSQRIVLCGRSAGGHLALLAAYEPGPVPIRAVISLYGPTDLARGYQELPSPDPIGVRSVLETFLGAPPSILPQAYRSASPISYVSHGKPSTLLIHGTRDHIVKVEFARDLHRELIRNENQAYLLELPWSEHAFDTVWFGMGNRVAVGAIEQFLENVT